MPRHAVPGPLPSQPRLECSNSSFGLIGLAENLDRKHLILPTVCENRFSTWSGFPNSRLCQFAFSLWNEIVACALLQLQQSVDSQAPVPATATFSQAGVDTQ